MTAYMHSTKGLPHMDAAALFHILFGEDQSSSASLRDRL